LDFPVEAVIIGLVASKDWIGLATILVLLCVERRFTYGWRTTRFFYYKLTDLGY
jgi:hypothetical protein